jgi:hypothetical protein
VPKVAIPRIGRSVIAPAEVAGRDDPKGAHGGEGPALRTAQGVLTVTRVVDDLAVTPTGQIKTAREHIASTAVPVAGVSLSVVPAHVVAITMVRTLFVTVASFIVVFGDLVRTRTAPDCQCIVVVPVAFVSFAWVSLVAVVARVEVHNGLPATLGHKLMSSRTQADVRVRERRVAPQSNGLGHARAMALLGCLHRVVTTLWGTRLRNASDGGRGADSRPRAADYR